MQELKNLSQDYLGDLAARMAKSLEDKIENLGYSVYWNIFLLCILGKINDNNLSIV